MSNNIKTVTSKKHQVNLQDGVYEEYSSMTRAGYVEVRYPTGAVKTIQVA